MHCNRGRGRRANRLPTGAGPPPSSPSRGAGRAVAASVLLDTQPAAWRQLPGGATILPLGVDSLRTRRMFDTDALAAAFHWPAVLRWLLFEAADLYTEARDIYQHFGNQIGLANTLGNLGQVAYRREYDRLSLHEVQSLDMPLPLHQLHDTVRFRPLQSYRYLMR